ncbi:MAG: flagellar basal body P-ring protein FlgI [Planctomycetota bacterium]|nr:flagellar basal body P-ring protein FlgI [Planctomycetota bacterium]
MRTSAPQSASGIVFVPLAMLFALAVCAGCSSSDKPKGVPPSPRYANLGPKEKVPAFMKGTVYEVADVTNKDLYPVYGYGLVVGLANTGDNNGTSQALRNFMVDEMVRHGFGSQDERLRDMKPELMIRDPRCAIVEVYGFLPPGARAGQPMDMLVRAAQGSQTKSLARGILYRTDLFAGGLDSVRPVRRVNVYAKVQGPVFVNPTNVDPTTRPSALLSQRSGTVMNGGLVMADRPLKMRVRTPQLSVSRSIEMAIDQRFADDAAANTLDEGLVDVFVPQSFKGDWEHFIGVVTHLYLSRSPELAAVKGKLLVAEAQQPNAPLLDISYCLEGLGPDVIPFVQPLYTHASPEVAFAAARAAAFLGDAVAEEALLETARSDGHAFQWNAVKVLGSLPGSTRIDRMMSGLVSAKNAMVRIEAYRVLADHGSPSIISLTVRNAFVVDRIASEGAPLVYATRMGVPRIAVFGRSVPVNMPIMFTAMQGKFSISTSTDGKSVVLFDRTNDRSGGIQAQMRPDLHELIYRLGGGSDDGFRFEYSDLVGVLQGLSRGRHIGASFVLQDLPAMQDAIEEAPPIVDPTGRPPVESPLGPGVDVPSLKTDKQP